MSFIDPSWVMQNSKERDCGNIRSGFFCQPQTVFQHPCPVGDAMISIQTELVLRQD